MAKGSSRERREEAEQRKAFDAEKARRAALSPDARALEDAKKRNPNFESSLGYILGINVPRGSEKWIAQEAERRRPDEEYKEAWMNVEMWRKGAADTYEQNISSKIVRMAAGGLRAGSQEWERSLTAIDVGYQNALTDIESGDTYGMIKEHAKDKGVTGDVNEWMSTDFGGGDTMSSRYLDREQGIKQYQSIATGTSANIQPTGL